MPLFACGHDQLVPIARLTFQHHLTRVRLPRSNPMVVAGSGERPGGVERSLWNGVELEVFGDAEAGLPQAGEALFQLPYTWM